MIDNDYQSETFDPQVGGLIIDESFNGCALIMKRAEAPETGSKCRIKLGRNAPYLAELVWSRTVEGDVAKAGFRFLE